MVEVQKVKEFVSPRTGYLYISKSMIQILRRRVYGIHLTAYVIHRTANGVVKIDSDLVMIVRGNC